MFLFSESITKTGFWWSIWPGILITASWYCKMICKIRKSFVLRYKKSDWKTQFCPSAVWIYLHNLICPPKCFLVLPGDRSKRPHMVIMWMLNEWCWSSSLFCWIRRLACGFPRELTRGLSRSHKGRVECELSEHSNQNLNRPSMTHQVHLKLCNIIRLAQSPFDLHHAVFKSESLAWLDWT